MQRTRFTYRAAKRNLARDARKAGIIADRLQPKKPRPQQEIVVHVVPPKRKPKERNPDTGKYSDTPHAPSYVSYAGYKSRQAQQCEINSLAEAGTTAKDRRVARQDRAQHHREVQAR